MNKLVDKTINDELKAVKKGSHQYQSRESMDARRAKDFFFIWRKRHNRILAEKWAQWNIQIAYF